MLPSMLADSWQQEWSSRRFALVGWCHSSENRDTLEPRFEDLYCPRFQLAWGGNPANSGVVGRWLWCLLNAPKHFGQSGCRNSNVRTETRLCIKTNGLRVELSGAVIYSRAGPRYVIWIRGRRRRSIFGEPALDHFGQTATSEASKRSKVSTLLNFSVWLVS